MADLPPMPKRTLIEKISIGIAAAMIVVGLVSLTGWLLQIQALLIPFEGAAPIKANEALCWTLMGFSLLALERGPQKAALVALIPALIGIFTLAEDLLGAEFQIDELLTHDFLIIETAVHGRMAAMTAGCIFLGSMILVWRGLAVGERPRLFSKAVCGSIISSVGLSTVLGYAINLPAVYRWGSATATSFISSLVLLALGIALLLSAWRRSYKIEGCPPIWSPMPPIVACFTMTVILWIGMREREHLYINGTTQSALNSLATLVDGELKQIISDFDNHVAIPATRTDYADVRVWETDATSFWDLHREAGCVSVSWIDANYVTRWFFPALGNEAWISFNHNADEIRAKALQTASSRKQTVYSQSISIPPNQGLGFAIYSPIFRQGRLAGFVCSEFTYQGFFSYIDKRRKISTDFETLIAINGAPVFGTLKADEINPNPFSLEFSINLQERRIRFTLAPNEANLQRNRRFLPELTLAAGLGITLLLGLSVHFARTARSGMLSAEESNRRLLTENDERRRIEERLKTSDERLRLALDSTGIGIFEWNVPSGYVHYSIGLWSMLGYEPGRMAPTPDTLQSLIHPEDLPHYRRRIDAQLSGGATYIDPEFRIRSRSGDWRWVYIRSKTIASLPNGTPTRILGTLQDITARREAEEALRASQAATRKLSLVASRTDNLVIIFAPDGRVEWVNESFTRLMEYPLMEIAGKRAAEFLSGADTDPRAIGRIRSAIAHGNPISTDIVQYSKIGRKFHLSYDIQPVRNKAAEIENFIAVASDITARVETEQALRRAKSEADAASRAKSEFLASMSHEIRTPMNGVIGMTSLLLETQLSQEQREFVNTIRHSGEALLTIINDILDFSKIESGKMEIERLPFELGLCIEEAMELFAVQAASKRLELVYHIDRDVPPCVLGDVTRLRQVLVNLVNNAVKFTPSGSIAVEVRRASGESSELGVPPGRMLLEFAIRDTGIGIPKDRLDRLFKVFSQVDSSTTRKYGGTGLGLAICERLCSLMGGEIRVDSVEGKGSSFIFTVQTEPSTNLKADTLPLLPLSLQKGTTLVVEDHPIGQKRIHSLLSNWGITPVLAATPEQALAAAASSPGQINLLMVDYETSQPGSTLEKYSSIKAPRLVMLPFGYAPPDTPNDGNSYAFIAKPLRAGGLYQTVSNIFSVVATQAAEAAKVREPVLGELIPLDILLVEDNPVNQKVAIRFLDRLGYKADSANNGLEAVNAIEGRNYQLVLMDLQMPEMDGLEASRQIRHRLPAERQPKIIALTANALHGDRELCLAAGMDDYITKPVKIIDIAEAIKRQFNSRT